ncbi:DUF3108 domain-containing protein [Crenalkalicoccus roseus]|uniref:DUF3108 domain-containing protein n=1 Tax=Crenalkalicoccus roseus TaxID=1485588 RepID=UPI0010813649|nr:DUF3108 domain-containing protein [Crenalkalicoccus roseus]
MRRALPLACLGLLLLPAVAGAAPFTARYEVRAAGLPLMRGEVVFDLGEAEYRLSGRLRAVGLVGLVVGGGQESSVEGRWQGARPVPRHFRSESTWYGRPQRVAMDYPVPGRPEPRLLDPPVLPDREPVPPELRHGTMDSLSALAKLTRAVALTGRCDGAVATFDGRWRTDIAARSLGTERIPEAGEALRCALEGRMRAGWRRDRDPADAARPHPATAWLASLGPGGTPVPVRVDVPSRWFGFFRIVLVGLEPGGEGHARSP